MNKFGPFIVNKLAKNLIIPRCSEGSEGLWIWRALLFIVLTRLPFLVEQRSLDGFDSFHFGVRLRHSFTGQASGSGPRDPASSAFALTDKESLTGVGEVAQLVERLPSLPEVLGLIPDTE